MSRWSAASILMVLVACAQAPTPGNQVPSPGDGHPVPTDLVHEESKDLATHSTGVYAVGVTNNRRSIPEAQYAAFIRKYRADGTLTWDRTFGISDDEYAEAVATDTGDNAYMVSASAGSVSGPQSVSDVFVRRFTPAGDVAWVRRVGTAAADYPAGVATFGSDVYVFGSTGGDLAGSVGRTDAFIRKYTDSGEVIWTRQFGTEKADSASDVDVDAAGNVYVVGATGGSLADSDDKGTIFVRRYDADGEVVWTRQLGYGDWQTFTEVAVSGDDVYVGFGYQLEDDIHDSDIRVVRFGTDGTQAEGWLADYSPVGNNDLWDLSTDSDGNVYFAGSTESGTSADRQDISNGMVVKLDPDGEVVWDREVVSPGSDMALAVVARTPDEVYGAGNINVVLDRAASDVGGSAFVRRLDGTEGTTVWTVP